MDLGLKNWLLFLPGVLLLTDTQRENGLEPPRLEKKEKEEKILVFG